LSGCLPDSITAHRWIAIMWVSIRDWLKEGGAIPNEQALYDDLISAEVVPRLDGKIQLESKEDMKKRGLSSPNCGDTLALSFALPVMGMVGGWIRLAGYA